MTLTEAMVASLVWTLTAVGVLQIWVASGRALAEAQSQQQALEVIDADLLRLGAHLQAQRSQPGDSGGDCRVLAVALAETLTTRGLASFPGLSRRFEPAEESLWVIYSFRQGEHRQERRRWLSPEALGLCAPPTGAAADPASTTPPPEPQ